MTLSRLLFAIFAFCSITVVYSRSVEECFEKRSDWCSNFSIAADCHLVDHCINNVWTHGDDLLALDGSSCSICIQQIENIREGLDSNVTKEVIQTALEYVCQMTFITKMVAKECEKMIDTYVDTHINDLLDLLRSVVDPQVICRVLLLCTTPPQTSEVKDAAVYFDNIVLHIPASNLQIISKVSRPVEHKVLGAKKCTWGPSYWCGNLTTSKECKSTSHCIAKSWSLKQYDEDNDSVCEVCKNMVKQARDQLLSNETQEELKEVLEGSCKLIPNKGPLKEIRQECINLADEFVPELTEMLASQMNPTAVCTVAGLCNSRRIDHLIAAANGPLNMDPCVNCTAAFTSFQRYMQSASEDDILAKMLNLCGQFSSYSDLCASLIASNFEDLYDVLKNQLPPAAACHFTGMCALKYHAHIEIDDASFQNQVETMLSSPNEDLPCDLCKQLVHHLQEVLTANTTEDEFRQMLLGMCQQTGRFKDECSKMVDENFHIIYTFLTEELDPSTICAEIAICPQSKNRVTDTDLNLISGRLIPASNEGFSLLELSPVRHAGNSAKTESHEGSIPCKLCHTVISVIQNALTDRTDEEDLKKVIEKACTLVPSSDEQKCEKFLDEYADVLMHALADETDPFVVCRDLKVCPTSTDPPKVKNSSALCPLCQDMLHYIQETLEDPTEEAEIEKAVMKVCNVVPKSIKDKCDEFISQYSALIISVLSQEIDPSLVCPVLKLCPATSPTKERCIHCRMFMTNLTQRVGNNNELEHVKNEVAKFIRSPVKGLEKSEAASELRVSHKEHLIDMMLAEFDPSESCVYTKFCDVEEVLLPLPSPVEVDGEDIESNEIMAMARSSNPDRPKPSCEVCQVFVKIYEKELTSNKTEQELEDMLENVCHKMKNKFVQMNCTVLVEKYVPEFLDLLKKNVSPKELCAAAKLCSLSTLFTSFDTECKSCEIVVGSLESVLGDPLVRENLLEEVVQVCDSMEGKSRSVCYTVATDILPQVESVVFEIPPWYVCAKLKMCPYGDRFDRSACSIAKSWCQDKQTAFMCDRVDYCRKNAWIYPTP